MKAQPDGQPHGLDVNIIKLQKKMAYIRRFWVKELPHSEKKTLQTASPSLRKRLLSTSFPPGADYSGKRSRKTSRGFAFVVLKSTQSLAVFFVC